jgi:transcriptional regulator with XRE-family HTH domain
MQTQDKFSVMDNFGERLRLMRRRLGLNQTDFGALGGVGLGSQQRYEAGSTEPAASYFAGLAGHGFDVVYLLTGDHSLPPLDRETSQLIEAVEALPPGLRAAVLEHARTLGRFVDGGGMKGVGLGSTEIHDPGRDFRPEKEG